MKKITRAAGFVIYKEEKGKPLYLLLRAYRNWDFPKGTIQNGESDFEAALRETEEETTLNSFEFPFNQESKETEVYSKGKISKFFIAKLKEGEPLLRPSPELGRAEHHEWRWVNFEEGLKLLPIHLIPILQWANARICSIKTDREEA